MKIKKKEKFLFYFLYFPVYVSNTKSSALAVYISHILVVHGKSICFKSVILSMQHKLIVRNMEENNMKKTTEAKQSTYDKIRDIIISRLEEAKNLSAKS